MDTAREIYTQASPVLFYAGRSEYFHIAREDLKAMMRSAVDTACRLSQARPLRSENVSGNYFSTLGVGAYAGRLFSENDDTPGAAPALVLSYKTWQSDFGADPAVVGSTVYVEMHPFVVAGIAPPGFFGDRGISNPPDFWMPLANEPVLEGANSALKGVDELSLFPIGRVRPGINTVALQTKLSVILREWLATRPTYSDRGGRALILGPKHLWD